MISIIVPVYNAEKYLSYCIESILNQTYADFELILINDGSTDTSADIIKKYANNNSKIKAVYQDNKGVSAARNKGILLSEGEYILFVDSDDMIHPDMLGILFRNIRNYNADIAECRYRNIFENDICYNDKNINSTNYLYKSNMEDSREESPCIYTGIEMCYKLYGSDFVNTCVIWNKLFKRELFCDNKFTEGIIHEDEDIIYRLFLSSKCVVCVENKLYYYLNRSDSIMGNSRSKDYISEDIINILYERYIHIKNTFDDTYKDLAILSFIRYAGFYIKKYCFEPYSDRWNKNQKNAFYKKHKSIYYKEKHYLTEKSKVETIYKSNISFARKIYYSFFFKTPFFLKLLLRVRNSIVRKIRLF